MEEQDLLGCPVASTGPRDMRELVIPFERKYTFPLISLLNISVVAEVAGPYFPPHALRQSNHDDEGLTLVPTGSQTVVI